MIAKFGNAAATGMAATGYLGPVIQRIAVCLCGVFWGASVAGAQPNAHEVVAETTEKVMAAVQAAPAYVDDDPQRYFDTIESILDPVIDFRGFARGVMGEYASSDRYRSLDKSGRDKLKSQLDEFTDVMRSGLVRTYSKGLLAFGGSRIQLSEPGPEDEAARTVSVRQLIFSEAARPYEVMYQMGRDRSGEWKLRNMIIETVNLGSIYRSQFEAAARKYDGLHIPFSFPSSFFSSSSSSSSFFSSSSSLSVLMALLFLLLLRSLFRLLHLHYVLINVVCLLLCLLISPPS